MISVIIKTCAYGLSETDLLKPISELQSKFEKLNKETELNICGEGGEYESLTLDCPLYQKRIVILENETVIHSADIFTKVCYVKITKFNLIEKSNQ